MCCDQESASEVPVERRGHLGRGLIEALAAVHSVDLETASLADLGKREDYVARQLRTWLRQFNAMTARSADYRTSAWRVGGPYPSTG